MEDMMVSINLREYTELIQTARDYRILVRTILRTASLSQFSTSELIINDGVVLEVLKSLGENVEGTIQNLRKEEE